MNEEIIAIGSATTDALKDNVFGALIDLLPDLIIAFVALFCISFIVQIFVDLIKGN